MTVEYRDETPFTNDLHTLQQIADALRHKKFGKDVREAIAQGVEKLYDVGHIVYRSGQPSGAFSTLQELKSKYPMGMEGIFVTADTGKWYVWNSRTNNWDEGGSYQAPMGTSVVQDAQEWNTRIGNRSGYATLQDALVGLYTKVVNQLENEKKQRNRLEKDVQAIYQNLPRTNYAKYKIMNVVDKEGNSIEGLVDDFYTFDFDKIGDDYSRKEIISRILTTPDDINIWRTIPVLELKNVPYRILDPYNTKKLKIEYVDYDFEKFNLSGKLKSMKIQGSSSTMFPKKNYTLKFDESIIINNDWGAHDKYVIKSNFNDASQVRNLLAAKIWGDMIKSRIGESIESINVGDDILVDSQGNYVQGSSDALMSIGKNYGAIDGFPIVLVINGEFHGIYNFNIPKDAWMANMGQGSKEAIISADYGDSKAEFFKGEPNFQGDFEIEYVTDENNSGWVKTSIAKAIDVVRGHYDTHQEYYDNISEYIDVDSAIDYFIHCVLIGNTDGTGKNYLLDTFDGKKWYFIAYDLDCTFGIHKQWQGTELQSSSTVGFRSYAQQHRMFEVILNHMSDKLVARWKFLRENSLSFNNLYKFVMGLYGAIPQCAFIEESKRWLNEPQTSTKDSNQLIFWLYTNLQELDKEIDQLEGSNNYGK